MRRFFVSAVLVLTVVVPSGRPLGSAAPFDVSFTADTMRVDFYQTGGRGLDVVALDRIVSDGPWPGSRTRLVDDTNLGKYLFEVIDRSSNQVIFSRGFASLFGEWETTAEAKEVNRTFSGSLRFPWPKHPVQVVLKKRDRLNAFHEFWSAIIDPAGAFAYFGTQMFAAERVIKVRLSDFTRVGAAVLAAEERNLSCGVIVLGIVAHEEMLRSPPPATPTATATATATTTALI